MKKHILLSSLLVASALSLVQAQALAMEVDWSGQFRAEMHMISRYTMDGSDAAATRAASAKNGYEIAGGGSTNADFETVFMRLRPKLIVNDNIYIKSEWFVGDPVYGIFGSSTPYTTEGRSFNTTFSRGSFVTAQRFWGEFLSDFGTLQIGRAPLHYGLGLVWNNGDGLWDRYQSTGDVVRLVAKFGSITLVPSFVSYSTGNTIGGACSVAAGGACNTLAGSGAATDYSLQLKYENADEEFEMGLNFIKRIIGGAQDATYGLLNPLTAAAPLNGANYNTWDLFGRRKLGKWSLAGEVPITSGSVAGMNYGTVAFAGEAGYRPNDTWDFQLKAGMAPGQGNQSGATTDQYNAFFFNQNYHVAMIMFNYQLANFAAAQTQNSMNTGADKLRSPYDNPIVNAKYLALGSTLFADKWRFSMNWAMAKADKVALSGQYFYNHNTRKVDVANAAAKDQSDSLGWELDLGIGFQWDDSMLFQWDTGLYMPGDFYRFTNTATDADVSSVFATALKVGVTF